MTVDHPWSEATADALSEATTQLVEALTTYVVGVRGMHGGSSEVAPLFALGDAVLTAATLWNERASDHTGHNAPLPLDAFDQGDEDEGDEDEDEDDELVEVQGQISVVSRWDLDVIDVAALVEAGRAAHQRLRSEETAEDTVAAIGDTDVPHALYAILHEAGEPWFELPGIELVSGARIYVQPEDIVEPDDGLLVLDDPPAAVAAPEGSVLFSESW